MTCIFYPCRLCDTRFAPSALSLRLNNKHCIEPVKTTPASIVDPSWPLQC